MKKIVKTVGKVLMIILAVLLALGALVYLFVLQYPKLKDNPKVGKWYRVTTSEMKTSEGDRYRAFFKKGSTNKVLIYFAGGGVSVNEETAREDTYNTKEIPIDLLANITMNMEGIASDVDGSPFENWSMILFPYATGDFHAGTGEFYYTDTDGKEKILYHNGYVNYTQTMKKVMELADDIFTHYFPDAESKNVLVDAALLLNDDWHSIAADVWETPKEISDKLVSNNLTLDCFASLHEKYGEDIHLLFDCSTRDGDLAKVQNYFDDNIMDVDEKQADEFQQLLKDTIPQFKEAGVNLFIWDGVAWYDDPRNMTAHTIIATPAVWLPFEEQQKSVAEWLTDAIDGKLSDYGIGLVDKEYPGEQTDSQ